MHVSIITLGTLALGYSSTEARRAVNDLDRSPDLTVEDRIRLALQRMGS